MNKPNLWLWTAIAILFLIGGGLSSPALADQSAITVTINGQKLELSEPPRLQSDECNYLWIIVPVREISNALGASVTWDSATNTATIVKGNQTIILKPGDREVWQNGHQFELATPPQIINNRLQVSLNFLASALGGRVKWDQAASMAQITTSQPVPLPKPERIEMAAFAARVAFTSDGHLWLVDGRQTDSTPISLTEAGPAEIVGWSSNGEWLAYLQSDISDEYASRQYLWVVKADGTGAIQLDERPVYITPSWSPTENLLAYTTKDPQEEYIPDGNLKISSLKTGVVTTTSLWPQNSEIIESLAWSPDGQSLAISLPRNEKHPLQIDQITLKGDHTNLLTLGETGKMENEIYTRVATGLKWSPNGRYLAYYLKPNSASISADGVAMQVLNIPQKKSIDLGCGLAYAQWLDWAPDSSQLAYIVGGGREATIQKRLHIVDVKTGQISDCGKTGQVDTQPRWLSTPASGILFCRGTETLDWEGQEQAGVLVPGQRIWHRTADGKELDVTSGPVDTADYAPHLSPDGQGLLFLRLTNYNCGSLYYQPMAGGPPKELIRGISGQPGYYGNYYPEWINIY
ncbi:copper amine oxidase domain protein [Desulfofarcimen acetoxidans DSM 771]|uniref:Copper amine oxidase domain protein n=1 Tax=Desulfofarcimen acetoxidans (strain ATCC 49208 / DSM 771 / KCTC 5769 / VKM B-1644 / 5575) TaxID=485916 RepID=C8W2A0_DESAS|nr:stalk domain-containing protein [Desulfofarcimen acetoxidans]ACV61764.1 copper amine oxidase domain protein [Desulfofarcimen acetoxidans DSM 771]